LRENNDQAAPAAFAACVRGRGGDGHFDTAFSAARICGVGRDRGAGAAYLANAAATTATVWWAQGFVEEEDTAFKKVVADYEKAGGNTIDYSIIPFAPERQKIVSAITSGEVPDLFQKNPGEIIALYAWDDKLVDLTDVIETQKEEFTETALLSTYCYNSVEKTQLLRRALYECGAAEPCLEVAGREGGVQDRGYAEDLGRLLRFLQGGAEEAA
jgi:hypothetical protein